MLVISSYRLSGMIVSIQLNRIANNIQNPTSWNTQEYMWDVCVYGGDRRP